MFNGKVAIGGKVPVRKPVPAARGSLDLFVSNYTPTILNPVNQAMVALDRGRTPEIKALREPSPLSPAASYGRGRGKRGGASRQSQQKRSAKPLGPVGRARAAAGKTGRKPAGSRARSRQLVDQVRQQASLMTPSSMSAYGGHPFGGVGVVGEEAARSRMQDAARQRRSGDFEF